MTKKNNRIHHHLQNVNHHKKDVLIRPSVQKNHEKEDDEDNSSTSSVTSYDSQDDSQEESPKKKSVKFHSVTQKMNAPQSVNASPYSFSMGKSPLSENVLPLKNNTYVANRSYALKNNSENNPLVHRQQLEQHNMAKENLINKLIQQKMQDQANKDLLTNNPLTHSTDQSFLLKKLLLDNQQKQTHDDVNFTQNPHILNQDTITISQGNFDLNEEPMIMDSIDHSFYNEIMQCNE